MDYRVRWTIQGTTHIEAKDEEEARLYFEEMEGYELVKDLISIEVYDVDEADG